MLKYTDTQVTFSEVPDEISLLIEISGCPNRCPECHSKYLWEDIGTELTTDRLFDLIDKNKGISCVCFMGGDQDLDELLKLVCSCKTRSDFPYKIAWYSGRTKIPKHDLIKYLDYIKVGPYNSKYGPLTSKTTNQRFYAKGSCLKKMDVSQEMFYDITDKFWKDER